MLVLLVVGGTAAIAFVFHDAGAATLRSLYRGLTLCASLLAIVAIAGIGLQAAIAARPAPTESGTAFASMLDTRFGQVWFARAGLAAVLAGVTLLAMSPRGQRKGAATDALVALAALLTLTLPTAGHASVRGPVAYLADAGHAAAAATWVGGLAFTSFAITRASSDRPAAAARFLPRFSVMAFAAVALLAVTAAVNAYSSRILRSTAANPLRPRRRAEECALSRTDRARIPQPATPGATSAESEARPARERFLRIAALELVLMAAVITATSALMDEPPPRASATASGRS